MGWKIVKACLVYASRRREVRQALDAGLKISAVGRSMLSGEARLSICNETRREIHTAEASMAAILLGVSNTEFGYAETEVTSG